MYVRMLKRWRGHKPPAIVGTFPDGLAEWLIRFKFAEKSRKPKNAPKRRVST